MRGKVLAAVVGVVFGLTLSWTGLSSPEVIREGLLFESSYLFLFFGSAVAVAFVGLRLVRWARVRALTTGKPVSWPTHRPQPRQITGSLLFGTGWAIAGTCPGPIATQLGQGIAWSLFTITGVVIGISLFLRREKRGAPATATPAGEVQPAPSATAVPGRA
jgi:uncharacterized membrane protein YedE/YeeE